LSIKKHIPNAITCGNLLCGCLAIVKAFEGDLVWAAYLVGIALVLDFFDGFTARLLKVASPIGRDLDSLADMVTFGVVPGVVMYFLILNSLQWKDGIEFPLVIDDTVYKYLAYTGFMIPIFSAIRLAKFNNDIRQSDSFIGLPTPANAMFICSIPLIYHLEGLGSDKPFTENPYVLCLVSCVLSLLLVAPLPLLALKFKNFGWADNKMRFILIGLSVICLAVFQFVGIPLVIILYILLSVINNLLSKKQKVA
jgi:CDP-diacylglycerol--serine O-phosphatidyltransferase